MTRIDGAQPGLQWDYTEDGETHFFHFHLRINNQNADFQSLENEMVSPRDAERNDHAETSSPETVAQQTTENRDHLIRPKKLSNPVLESPNHRLLHRELRVSHRRGLVPAEKCELQRVMEQRRLEQQRDGDQALRPLTDLEQELGKRRQRLHAYELEEQKKQEDPQNVPEFVRVKDNLRRVHVS